MPERLDTVGIDPNRTFNIPDAKWAQVRRPPQAGLVADVHGERATIGYSAAPRWHQDVMPRFEQHIRFCKSRDGARIAVATVGRGPPLLRTAHWLSHAEHDARSPVWTHWLEELSRDHTFIRYDPRGCGLSDRSPPCMFFEAWIDDLEAVVEAQGLKQFSLFGMSQGGAIAIAYAARHPEKISRLVLFGAYGKGALRRDITKPQREEAETLVKLIRLGWGRDNPAFRQVFTSQFIPDGTRDQHQWFNDLERTTASPESAAAILEMLYQIDVTEDAQRISVPTLILHSRGDERVPFEEGRQLAALIPSARFVPLHSRNHVLLADEPAWSQFLQEVRAFVGNADGIPGSLPRWGLTTSEQQVLALVARGLDNGTIAGALAKSEKTVRNQVTSIFAKLGVRTRAQAIVLARDAGVGSAS
jgi:pimeloyl-ACP methyl ester carboxylesterase/DNA-binding CsgD family transcriptional regulator